ncbi:hypothetical protein A2U01_0036525, partial [Trifolium medium]|nr:hypothetical protein [Trifolium medium]
MSQTSNTSQIKNKSDATPSKDKATRSSSKEKASVLVIDVKPLNSIHASASTRKTTRSKFVVKKEKVMK